MRRLFVAIVCVLAGLVVAASPAGLTDKHRYLSILGKTRAEARKVLGKPSHEGDDGSSWHYTDFKVKPFTWFTVQTRWEKASDPEWRNSPEKANLRVQGKPMAPRQIFTLLGFDLSQWKEVTTDEQKDWNAKNENKVYGFEAGPYKINLQLNPRTFDLTLGKNP